MTPDAAVCGESVGAPVSLTPSWSGASLCMDLRRRNIGPSTCPAVVPYFMDRVVASQLHRARFAWSSSALSTPGICRTVWPAGRRRRHVPYTGAIHTSI